MISGPLTAVMILLVLALLDPGAHASAQDSAPSAHACPNVPDPNLICRPYASAPFKSSRSSGLPRVTYFFSYTCTPCNDVGNFLDSWSERSKVFVYRIHAVWDGKPIREAASAYYAFKRLAVTETVGASLVAAIRAKQYRFGGPDELAALAEAHGVRGDLVRRALASRRNAEELELAAHAVRAYRVESVPFIAVDDRYAISVRSTSAPTLAELGMLLDMLVARPQSDR